MNGETTLYSIGDLARRTGLTVKAIRFYSDTGIVPPTERTAAGYRLYGSDAAARLELVRTLRELGIGLDAVRQVVAQEASLARVAATHAEALDVQIRILRQRRAVLTAVARRDSTPQEMDAMHRLAGLSEAERQHLTDDFLGSVFGGLRRHPAFAAVTCSLTPLLPDDPEPEQIEAWVELAELMRNADFRTTLHGVRGTWRPIGLRTTPWACPGSSPKRSAHRPLRRSRRASRPTHPRWHRSSRPSRPTTRTSSATRPRRTPMFSASASRTGWTR